MRTTFGRQTVAASLLVLCSSFAGAASYSSAVASVVRLCDPGSPAATLTNALETMPQWAADIALDEALPPVAKDAELRSSYRLGSAMLRVLLGDGRNARTLLKPLVSDEGAATEDRAFANLLLALAGSDYFNVRENQALSQAYELYWGRGRADGAMLCLAMLARNLSGHEADPLDAEAAWQIASQSVPLLDKYVKITASLGASSSLADLNAAWASVFLAEHLSERDQNAALARYEDAKKLAVRAAEGGAADSVITIAAQHLAMHAQLSEVRVGLRPMPDQLFKDEGFFEYVDTVRSELLQVNDARLLITGLRGVLDNQGLVSSLLMQQGERRRAVRVASQQLELAMATQLIAEPRPPLRDPVECVLGQPFSGPAQQLGIQAALTLERYQDEDDSSRGGLFANGGDAAFWFYDRAKAAALVRVLAKLGGETQTTAAERRERDELARQRDDYAVKFVHERIAETAQDLGRTGRGAAAMQGQGGMQGQGLGAQRPRPGRPGRGPRGRGGPPGDGQGFPPPPPGQGEFGRPGGLPGGQGGANGPLNRNQVEIDRLRGEIFVRDLGRDEDAQQQLLALFGEHGQQQQQAASMTPQAGKAIVVVGYDWIYFIGHDSKGWRFPGNLGSRKAVMQMVSQLCDRNQPEAKRVKLAEQLYEAYLQPVEDDLRDVKTLVIVPEPPLTTLPFEALVTNHAAGGAWAKAQFVADRHEVSYAPSLAMLRYAKYNAKRKSRTVELAALAIGDVKPAANLADLDANGTRFTYVPSRGAELLKPLAHTGEEARQVVAAVGADRSELLLGEDATKAKVVAGMVRADLLHFATHGVPPADGDPLGGGLLLSPEPDGQAGVLTVGEVYRMELPARLAVLSACDTAKGASPYMTAGVTSLARAFLYAGVRNVVASLWEVDDEATAGLMKHFYERDVKRRGEAVESLAEAKRELRTDQHGKWADPYYWAGFLMFN